MENQKKAQRLLVRAKWRQVKGYLCGERGPWKSRLVCTSLFLFHQGIILSHFDSYYKLLLTQWFINLILIKY